MITRFVAKMTPLLAEDMLAILRSGSPALDAYLGEEIYVKTDPAYLAAQKRRFIQVLTHHIERVGNRPTYLLRAPGRLNAFLEYLDMCDGDHMSTTIDGDIPLAVSPRADDVLNVGNINPLFPAEQLSINEEFVRFAGATMVAGSSVMDDNWDNHSLLFPYYGREQGHWLNYVLSPYLRMKWDMPELQLCGADITFGAATVPFRAGTSSSSAVVVLSFLALWAVNKDNLPPWTVSEVCRLLGEAEWYVGTHGGANDQMTILLNATNSVSYNRHSEAELHATPLPFLRGVHVVLANSLWEVNKSAGGNQSFNMRKGWMALGDKLLLLLIESVQAAISDGVTGEGWLCALVRERFGYVPGFATPLLEEHREYWERIAANYRKFGSLNEQILGVPNAAIEELMMLLPVKITPEEAGAILNMDAETVTKLYTKPKRSIGGYHVRTTARFFFKQNIIGNTLERIFLEAEQRVTAGEISPDSPEYDAYRTEVGGLVDTLQDALTFDFRVSVPQLDLLLSIAKRGPGYLGGKLTGAGKGGCVSILVRAEHSQEMCCYLDREYYRKPERFEFYRQVLHDEMRFSAPGSKEFAAGKERLEILNGALAAYEEQRRVITFSHGACALDFARFDVNQH